MNVPIWMLNIIYHFIEICNSVVQLVYMAFYWFFHFDVCCIIVFDIFIFSAANVLWCVRFLFVVCKVYLYYSLINHWINLQFVYRNIYQ